ncbi:hypothetical protein [Trichocoleus desertorum]
MRLQLGLKLKQFLQKEPAGAKTSGFFHEYAIASLKEGYTLAPT